MHGLDTSTFRVVSRCDVTWRVKWNLGLYVQNVLIVSAKITRQQMKNVIIKLPLDVSFPHSCTYLCTKTSNDFLLSCCFMSSAYGYPLLIHGQGLHANAICRRVPVESGWRSSFFFDWVFFQSICQRDKISITAKDWRHLCKTARTIEIKLKRNWNKNGYKIVLFLPKNKKLKHPWKRFTCLAKHSRYPLFMQNRCLPCCE